MRRLLLTLVLSSLASAAHAQQSISLMTPKEAWSFNNGAEFPGAKGGLTLDPEARPGSTAFKLVGDFTKGGRYVQAGRKIDKIDIRELSLWIRNPDAAKLTMRLGDASGQTHQIVIRMDAKPDWQKIVFPVEHFFAKRGQADAVTSVAKYESWGGGKDGRWHGPATGLYILLGNAPEKKEVRTLWLSDITVTPRPTIVPGGDVATVVPLADIVEGEHDWRFSNGPEFKGAKGSLTVVTDQPAAGQSCFKLAGDFTGGGAYVAAIKETGTLGLKDVSAIRLRVKSDTGASLRVQLKDATGQTHQRPRVPIAGDGKWHDMIVKPTEVAGGEHWGGANDGKWHGPPAIIVLSLAPHAKDTAKQPVLFIADVRADAMVPVFMQPAAFTHDFEALDKLPADWTTQGDVAIDAKAGHKSARSLVLARTLDTVEKPCSVASPTFPAAAGKWDVRFACKPDLHSPDNSYSAVVALECLDANGKAIERFTLADVFGKRDWQAINKPLELPKTTVSARFHVQLNKTYGRYWLDDISASYLAPAPRRDDRITRMLFATAQLGNLLYPTDSRKVSVTVEAIKPLRESQLQLRYEVRDYWGAEQATPATVPLVRSDKKPSPITYEAALDLAGMPLEVGRYYEVHASIPQEGPEPFRNFTSLAILPEAGTKRHKPDAIPFTSRNWDNRINEYFHLSDRLGLRTCGIWGGWSSKAPYTPEAPNIDLCKKLDMGVLTRTPISNIEKGKTDYDEQALRQGVRNWIEKYGQYRPLTISLGNEPHGTGERVRNNVAAYKTVYEEIKKVDPTIFVIATAVEPNEEYFQLGYGKWCDAYDFHVYEGFANVRRNIEKYQALMKQFGPEKPIWSTELGLNSQGMTRHVVAVEVTKTLTTFFAAGGVNASWFGILYPDPDAKSYGSAGDAHNVFDCRYKRYAPRLDAIAYYNAVNAIGAKKFRAEKKYGDVSAFLFDDGKSRLQVLWKAKGRQDVFVPLAGVKEVTLIQSDGRRRTLDAAGKGLTVSVSDDPLLLLYEGGEADLAMELGAPAATLTAPPTQSSRREPITLKVALKDIAADGVDVIAPPLWTVKKAIAGDEMHLILAPPQASGAREANVIVTLGKGTPRGELYHRITLAD